MGGAGGCVVRGFRAAYAHNLEDNGSDASLLEDDTVLGVVASGVFFARSVMV